MKTKLCSKCKELKNLDSFFKDKHTTSGFTSACKQCRNETHLLWCQENKVELNSYNRKCHSRTLDKWKDFIPSSTNCAICSKEIFFNKNDINKAIHFDHRHGRSDLIKQKPTVWLRDHKRTPENEKIWESCDFGILCRNCNSSLPTKNRIEWIEAALKYAKDSEGTIKSVDKEIPKEVTDLK